MYVGQFYSKTTPVVMKGLRYVRSPSFLKSSLLRYELDIQRNFLRKTEGYKQFTEATYIQLKQELFIRTDKLTE